MSEYRVEISGPGFSVSQTTPATADDHMAWAGIADVLTCALVACEYNVGPISRVVGTVAGSVIQQLQDQRLTDDLAGVAEAEEDLRLAAGRLEAAYQALQKSLFGAAGAPEEEKK